MKRQIALLLAAVLLLLPSCGTQTGPDLTPLDQAAAEASSFIPGTYENLTFRQGDKTPFLYRKTWPAVRSGRWVASTWSTETS